MDTKTRFIHSVITGITGVGIKAMLSILFIPVMLAYLGADHYGFYVILIGLIELAASLDLGLATGLIHRLGTYTHQGDRLQVREQLTISHGLFSLMALGFFLFGWLAAPWLSSVFHIAIPHARQAFLMVAVEAALNVYSRYYRCVLMAHNLGQWPTLADTLQSIINSGVGFLLLLTGMGLLELLWLRLGVGAMRVGFLMTRAIQVERLAWFPNGPFRWSSVKDLSSVSTYSMVLQLCCTLASRMDVMIIGARLGMTAVAMYALIVRIYGQVSLLGTLFSDVLFPMFTRFHSLTKTDEARYFFLRISAFLNYLVGVLLIWLTVDYRPIFQVLAQDKVAYAETLPLLWVIIPTVWSTVIMMPASTYLFANRHFHYQTRLSVVASLLNLGLSLWLVGYVGIIGVALGTLVPHVIEQQVFLIPRTCRELALPYGEYLTSTYLRNLLPWSLAWGVLQLYPTPAEAKGASAIIPVFIDGLLAIGASGFLWLAVASSREEHAWIRERLRPVQIRVESREPVEVHKHG